jgi:hypothetical protein
MVDPPPRVPYMNRDVPNVFWCRDRQRLPGLCRANPPGLAPDPSD